MNISKFLLLIFICITVFLASRHFELNKPIFKERKKISSVAATVLPPFNKLKEKSTGLAYYCKQNKMNDQFCFLIDMNINPGSKRFFVYDLKNEEVIDAGLVTHGRCNESG